MNAGRRKRLFGLVGPEGASPSGIVNRHERIIWSAFVRALARLVCILKSRTETTTACINTRGRRVGLINFVESQRIFNVRAHPCVPCYLATCVCDATRDWRARERGEEAKRGGKGWWRGEDWREFYCSTNSAKENWLLVLVGSVVHCDTYTNIPC